MSNSTHGEIRQRRETTRKTLIRKILDLAYREKPVLIEELRWRVFSEQFANSPNAPTEITRSFQNSFARTLREQIVSHRLDKVAITSDTPIGVIARAATYRLRSVNDLSGFLASQNACILCRYKTNQEVNEPRYLQAYVTPHHHIVSFRFFEKRPNAVTYGLLEETAGTLIPATQELTIVCPEGIPLNLEALTPVPWNLFGYIELDNWYEVSAHDPLSSVQRNSLV